MSTVQKIHALAHFVAQRYQFEEMKRHEYPLTWFYDEGNFPPRPESLNFRHFALWLIRTFTDAAVAEIQRKKFEDLKQGPHESVFVFNDTFNYERRLLRELTLASYLMGAVQETSYLLQRIEEFQGLIILATNFKPNIDSAFLRRFQSIVYFKLPGISQRVKLWEKALSRLPGENQVDVLKIANDYEIAGGFINNAVQFAWLNARKNNSKIITNQDVLLGIKREYAKEGKLFNN